MRRWAYILLGSLAAWLCPPLAAQPPSTPTEQAPIVVEGHRDRDSEINELVGALPPAPANGHIRRFEHDACPAVLGLPPAQRDFVVARMRAVGAAARVPIGRPRCMANVLVLVTADKGRLIEQLIRRYPTYLGDLNQDDLRRIMASPAPTALWHLSGIVDADGRQMTPNVDDVVVNRTTRGSSRLTDLAHPEYVGSVLVVERRAVEGLTVTQLADYAAMRVFSGADPARLGDRNLPTILTALDVPMGGEVPITLTAWDLAFLGSLYASNVSIHAPGQRGEIQSGMRRTLERSADPAQHP
ncbi:MAG: hypothetical protein JO276_00155 [Sphingomonadaceae bacterium]|nr:hypothetical protein [Sphingomonadaceae bacterium]